MVAKKKSSKGSGASSAPSRITDSRFASFETDPRFRLPSSKKTKTTIDKRFAHMLKSEDFLSSAKVDRYGRKLKSDAGKKALQNLYRQEEEDEEEDEDEDEKEGVEEAGSESQSGGEGEEDEESKTTGRPYDPARDGGFSSSESDSESEDEEAVKEVELDTSASMQRFADEQADVEEGEVTNRIAIVNLDWDYIKSHDLMALFTSFLPPNGKGKIERISIYPSEFGKERMQREELEGPPREIFRNSKKQKDESDDDDDSDSDAADERIKQELLKEEDDKDFDSDALRAYQLDRLRYYYAVMTCSDPKTAHTLYEATDGTEYLSSSNFIDLRFIPDDVTFDDKPRDECTSVPDGYEPVEFVTNALQSSKVKLTWDIHPEEAARKQSMKKAFSGSRAEMQDNDLRAYLASDTEDEAGSEEEGEVEGGLSKKELAKKKLREALGLGDESTNKSPKDGPVGDMQITFTSALIEDPKKKAGKEEVEETTIEKYVRKERERKQKKKEKAVAKRGADGSGDEEEMVFQDNEAAGETEDLGFDDPFFTTEEPAVTKSQLRKEERRKKREAREAENAQNAAEKEKLQRIMDDGAEEDGMSRFQHFDMKEIIRAEKDKNKKKKKKGKGKHGEETSSNNLQEGQKLQLDDRFKSLFESHEYAIDTSNPAYTRTETMQKMLDEGRKRKGSDRDGESRDRKKKKARRDVGGDDNVDLSGLVASVKEKTKRKSRT